MFGMKLNRYIAKEILAPTLLCLLIFTIVLLMGRLIKLVDLVVNKGVSLNEIFALFVLLLPAFLHIILPLSFLMGIMIGLSRMSTDNETVALKAAGFGLAKISRPVIILAVLFSLLTGISAMFLKPWGYQAFKKQIFEITMQKATIGFQSQVFMNQFSNMVLYADKLDERSGVMSGLFVVEEKPGETMQIFAEKGHIMSDEKLKSVTFRLENGTIHRMQNNKDSSFQLIHFRNYDVQPELTENNDFSGTNTKRLRPKEMATVDLWKQPAFEQQTISLSQRRAISAELHTRLTSALAPFLFALFGLPFSIQSHRSGRSGGFVIGLVIYLIYYLNLSLAQTLTADAGISPVLSFWAPHLLLVIIGSYCLYQSSQEAPNKLVSWVDNIVVYCQKRLAKNYENA
jgi:lipopolysaccharide export system permease protein